MHNVLNYMYHNANKLVSAPMAFKVCINTAPETVQICHPHLCHPHLVPSGTSPRGCARSPPVRGYIYIYIYVHTRIYIYIYI